MRIAEYFVSMYKGKKLKLFFTTKKRLIGLYGLFMIVMLIIKRFNEYFGSFQLSWLSVVFVY